MKYILLVFTILMAYGCTQKKEIYSFGWGPRLVNGQETIVAGEFLNDSPAGKFFQCDDECKELWAAHGMDVAMGDLVRRKARNAGYEYRLIAPKGANKGV